MEGLLSSSDIELLDSEIMKLKEQGMDIDLDYYLNDLNKLIMNLKLYEITSSDKNSQQITNMRDEIKEKAESLREMLKSAKENITEIEEKMRELGR